MPFRQRRRKPDAAAGARQLATAQADLDRARRTPATGTTTGWRRRRDLIRTLEARVIALESACRAPIEEESGASLPF